MTLSSLFVIIFALVTWFNAGADVSKVTFYWGHENHGCPYSFGGTNIIAHAYYPIKENKEWQGQVHFNVDADWSKNDLYSVALHEFGHAIGLMDNYRNPESVMYYLSHKVTGLSEEDKELLKKGQ